MSTSQPENGAAQVVVAPGATTPASSDDYNQLKDQFNKVVESKIGKIAVAVTALALPIVTAFCAWLQKKIGIKLDAAALTAFVASIGGGIAITAYKWLSNRGSWERAVIDAYRVYLTGQSATTNQVVLAAPAAHAAANAPHEQT